MTVSYHEDPMPRGAAGAVRDAAAASSADTFVITDGTAIPNVDLHAVLLAHHAAKATVTVVVHSEPARNGNPCLQVPTGVYIFNREALRTVPLRGFYDIKENLIPELYRAGQRVVAYAAPNASPRVLDASSYLAVNEWVVEQLATSGEQPTGYVRSGNCLIHSDAVIADDAVFVGPALIGPGARVMSGAVVVGPTSIGREATIGPGVLVSRSAIWRRCVIGEHAVADRCILADDTVVEPYTQAFRAVMASNFRREPEMIRDAAVEPRESASLELLRRMGRLLNSATWSRSPAAQ
jgi:NDP-sugar pyrophosphorylase family protein